MILLQLNHSKVACFSLPPSHRYCPICRQSRSSPSPPALGETNRPTTRRRRAAGLHYSIRQTLLLLRCVPERWPFQPARAPGACRLPDGATEEFHTRWEARRRPPVPTALTPITARSMSGLSTDPWD